MTVAIFPIATVGVERVRRRRDEDRPHIDLSSVWLLAGALLLAPPLAVGVAVAVYAHLYLRVWRGTVPVHRVLFSTATVVLAVLAASSLAGPGPGGRPGVADAVVVFSGWAGFGLTVLALLAYALTNMLLVMLVIVLSGRDRSWAAIRRAMGDADQAALELATLALGVLAAAAVAAFGPAHALLVLPPLIVLHRAVLVRQLEEAARTDGKTGLLNAMAWHAAADTAAGELSQDGRMATVLVLDLDHFKAINDRHGHLVGDRVLSEVAAAVRAEVRDDDPVGRFGGEEFVVLVRGPAGSQEAGRIAVAVAERMRRRVAGLQIPVVDALSGSSTVRLTVSIGVATGPTTAATAARLLERADVAMYAAKAAGRNRVRVGGPDPDGSDAGGPGPVAPDPVASDHHPGPAAPMADRSDGVSGPAEPAGAPWASAPNAPNRTPRTSG